MYNNSSLSSIVYGGIFMALTILFTYVFAIQTTFIRVDFAFIPICLYAMRFGTAKTITLKKLLLMNLTIFLFVDCILNNIWLTLMYKDAATSFYIMRIVKSVLLLPIKAAILYNIYKPLRYFILKYNN